MIEASVIIPTFNRASRLHDCLQALGRQTAAAEKFEVVVVDDGSSDDTAAMLEQISVPFRLRVERQENRGAGAARNRGVGVAGGRYCIFLDDDIIADPGLVAGHLRVQAEHRGVVAIGALRISASRRSGGLVKYFTDWWEDHYRSFEAGESTPDFWDGYSGNLSTPRQAVLAAGGFDETLGRSEDVELTYRLQQAGLAIAYAPDAAGEQVFEKGFREIVRDFDAAGAAAVVLWRRHPEFLDHAPLGDFSQGTQKAVLARRLLLAIRAPTWPLALVDPLLARHPSQRLYRFLQLHCFWRSLRAALDDRETWRRLTRGPVILMYHAIGHGGEPASRYVLPAARFRRQIAWLRLRRRPVLSLDEYAGYRADHDLPPAKSVIITFDDGYAEVVDLAAPTLARHRLPATLFAVTGFVGAANGWDGDGPLADRPLLSWGQLRKLAADGFEIGSHTVSHPDLTAVDPDEASREITESAAELEREMQQPGRHFSYPYGRRNSTVQSRVEEAGYTAAVGGEVGGAVGIEPGPNGPAVPSNDLRRMEVWGTRPLFRFVLDLWLGMHLGRPDRGNAR